ncbi:MAG: hypothetical protein Q9184_006894, partial [Pyrenodesmia sp. 2 TL-2023]
RAPILVVLIVCVLVRIHPEPADDCPCFDDSVAFAGVIIGVEVGNWHFAQTDLAWDLPAPATVPFQLHTIGWLNAIARIVVGVVVIFAWREFMKPTLLKYLPPLFRVVESLGLSLPRKFFVQASMYTRIPKNLKTDNVLPPVSEIPSLIKSLRHPRKHRSVSVGPQSEADAYEALAFRDSKRRESNASASRLRHFSRRQGGSNNFDDVVFGHQPSSTSPTTPRVTGLPTPAASQVNLYNDVLSADVALLDPLLTPGTHPSGPSTPNRRLSEDRREREKDESEIFSMLEKPRVRYDVEVVTKLVVYTEPIEATQKTSLDSTQDSQFTSQHGFHILHDLADSFPPCGERSVERKPRSRGIGLMEDAPPESSEQHNNEPERRLSSTSSRSSKRTGSPVDRIIEHEEAVLIPPKRRNEGPSFTLIRRKGSGKQRVNLTDFPNEVLTHVLSHLPAPTLSEVSLVSRRFHSLVKSPHAWRIAFTRHFPAQKSLTAFDQGLADQETDADILRSERRVFTRLTAFASWRSEYILRTQLIRSLGRGKPASTQDALGSSSSRSISSNASSAQVTYNSNLVTTVNHLHATFGTSLNKRLPSFIHGTDEVGAACLSDPRAGRVDHWGFADPQSFTQFVDDIPGVAQYGLGPGEVVGVPNTMDVSRQYGMVYAEGIPCGRVYYRSTEERRGRLLHPAVHGSWPELGIPDLSKSSFTEQTPCSLWISKGTNLPDCSEGLIGILSGSSKGVVTAYSLGTSGVDERRIERGEITCRWILSPGVPIIAICVDEDLSPKRLGSGRIWAVALNALGEVYYLTEIPTRCVIDRKTKLNAVRLEQLAWETGRTVHWAMAEPSRRIARPDPFQSFDSDGSYSPRSSWRGMGLSPEQITAESREIEQYLRHNPKHFRKINDGWDMRRRLEVDFAGDDGSSAGENVVVIQCGLDEDQSADIKRYTRCKVPNPDVVSLMPDTTTTTTTITSTNGERETRKDSLFGGNQSQPTAEPSWSFDSVKRSSSAHSNRSEDPTTVEEWRTSNFSLGGLKAPQITTAAIDLSIHALLTVSEDPLLNIGGGSITSSPTTSPLPQMPRPSSARDIPGRRARLLAVGTKNGTIITWNMRDPISTNTTVETTVKPVRIIYTDSPQISCLAVSALYIVHGGNDGLVQAWDPLASTMEPIRTLNSRFSSRARRRLVQAEASPQGVGINLFAAGAVFLDPDPTVLRGMVSLGTHLRYWSYSSSAADQYKARKRHLRRSGRRSSSNQAADNFTPTGRGALKDYIANEKLELEKEKASKRKEEERLAGRFGLDLLGPGATEDEILAYATMLSEEAAANDEQRRKSESESGGEAPTMASAFSDDSVEEDNDTETMDPDIAEAIRLSLQESPGAGTAASSSTAKLPIKIRKTKHTGSSPPLASSPPRSVEPGTEQDDLDFALQLSLAEEQSREVSGKGKGRET